MKDIKYFISAFIMGLLTFLLCVVIADCILHMSSPADSDIIKRYFGIVVFWTSLIGLPVYFGFMVKWRYTVINLPLYFFLYFPVSTIFGSSVEYFFMSGGGVISFPEWFDALGTALILWIIQSIVFSIGNTAKYIIRKINIKRPV